MTRGRLVPSSTHGRSAEFCVSPRCNLNIISATVRWDFNNVSVENLFTNNIKKQKLAVRQKLSNNRMIITHTQTHAHVNTHTHTSKVRRRVVLVLIFLLLFLVLFDTLDSGSLNKNATFGARIVEQKCQLNGTMLWQSVGGPRKRDNICG